MYIQQISIYKGRYKFACICIKVSRYTRIALYNYVKMANPFTESSLRQNIQLTHGVIIVQACNKTPCSSIFGIFNHYNEA